jgi:CRP-like cAMP-binding protein
MLNGIACRYRTMLEGRRQIISLQFAGDMCDLHSLLLEPLDHAIGALSACTVAQIPHETVRQVIRRYPRLGEAFWRDTLIDGSVFREWIVSLGRRSAYARVAHLFCEALVRLRAVGVVEGCEFDLPLTQGDLADVFGLSIVHVNRVMQRLRAEGLLGMRGGRVAIHDWPGLKAAAEFSSAYLHLGADAEPAPASRRSPSQAL